MDQSTANVILLAYVNGRIWQENTAGSMVAEDQPERCMETAIRPSRSARCMRRHPRTIRDRRRHVFFITDASGNTWTITNGQVTVDGVADPTTNRVIALAYAGGSDLAGKCRPPLVEQEQASRCLEPAFRHHDKPG